MIRQMSLLRAPEQIVGFVNEFNRWIFIEHQFLNLFPQAVQLLYYQNNTMSFYSGNLIPGYINILATDAAVARAKWTRFDTCIYLTYKKERKKFPRNFSSSCNVCRFSLSNTESLSLSHHLSSVRPRSSPCSHPSVKSLQSWSNQ